MSDKAQREMSLAEFIARAKVHSDHRIKRDYVDLLSLREEVVYLKKQRDVAYQWLTDSNVPDFAKIVKAMRVLETIKELER